MANEKIVNRRKTYRDEQGLVVGYGKPENYVLQHPRDYSVTPKRAGELRNADIFARSMQQALSELKNPALRAEWSRRWHAQLLVPDPDAPVDRKTRRPHIYRRLDRYVQAVIQRQLLSTPATILPQLSSASAT